MNNKIQKKDDHLKSMNGAAHKYWNCQDTCILVEKLQTKPCVELSDKHPRSKKPAELAYDPSLESRSNLHGEIKDQQEASSGRCSPDWQNHAMMFCRGLTKKTRLGAGSLNRKQQKDILLQ